MEKKTGTVVKFNEKYIVLLMPDGSFKNVKRSRRQTPLIGERFTLDAAGIPALKYRWAAMAAVACLVLAAFLRFGVLLPDSSKTAYIVALDINPSIEIQTDKEFKTLSIEPLNEDAKKVAVGSEYLNMDLLTTIDGITDKCISNGYLNREKKGFIKITVVPVKENSFAYEYKNSMKESLQKLLKSKNIEASLEIGISSADILDKARRNNLSINRYILYKNILEKGIGVTIDEARKMSLQELKDYETLQINGMEKNTPEIENNSGNTGEAGPTEMPDNKGGNGINDTADPDNSENSDTSKSNGNTDSGKGGTSKSDSTDGKADGISATTSDDNTNKESGNTNIDGNIDITGTESGSTEGKSASSEGPAGTGNTPSPEPATSGALSGEGIGQSQEPANTSNGSPDTTSNGTDSGVVNGGSTNGDGTNDGSTGSSNKHGQ